MAEFQGAEFDWLRARVERMLWRPDGVTSRPPPRPVKSAMEAIAAVDRDIKSVLGIAVEPHGSSLPSGGLTVAEYNAFRGMRNRRQAEMPYVHQEYPRMLYRNGEHRVAKDAIEHARLALTGWKEHP